MTTDLRKLENDLRRVCRSWWRSINGVDKDGEENRDRADRKSRAELRRADRSQATAATPSISSAPML